MNAEAATIGYIIEEIDKDGTGTPVWVSADFKMPSLSSFLGSTIPVFNSKKSAEFWAAEWTKWTDRKYKITGIKRTDD